MIGKYVIVRTFSAGVHIGYLKSLKKKQVVLTNSRRIWSWAERFTLSAIAISGVGDGSKLSASVPEILLTEAIEVIPVSPSAQTSLEEFPCHTP